MILVCYVHLRLDIKKRPLAIRCLNIGKMRLPLLKKDGWSEERLCSAIIAWVGNEGSMRRARNLSLLCYFFLQQSKRHGTRFV